MTLNHMLATVIRADREAGINRRQLAAQATPAKSRPNLRIASPFNHSPHPQPAR